MSKLSFNYLVDKISMRIKQMTGYVILRSDISDLGNPSQINRALQILIKRTEIVRMGKGIYAKAYFSERLNKPIIVCGFDIAATEALMRLGVLFELDAAHKSYNEGRSTQVPIRIGVRLKSRFRGKLAYGKREMRYEDNINRR